MNVFFKVVFLLVLAGTVHAVWVNNAAAVFFGVLFMAFYACTMPGEHQRDW